MNKKCDNCQKTVYPIEELKCLDKVWHKACFKCQVCGMTLNMKNYKGYNKKPYCNAHYPTTKFTAVADTPENRRLAQNTENQSLIKYHKEFEKEKGKFTSVADDPETLRLRENTKAISLVEYQGIKEKKDTMEGLRPSQEDKQRARRQVQHQGQRLSGMSQHTYYQTPMPPQEPPAHAKQAYAHSGPQDRPPQPTGPPQGNAPSTPQSVIYRSGDGQVRNPQGPRVGSISEYDPMNEKYGSIAAGYSPASQAVRPNQPPPPAQHSQYRGPPIYRAVYDYDAADDDEVSFREGDRIINVTQIDAGWMTGSVERTGQHGMLPANYVEQANY